jgi:hypothetical protein
MKPTLPSSRVSRRVPLSSAAALPTLSELVAATTANAQGRAGVLPSWNDGPAKQAIIEFVHATTTTGSPNFVPPAERSAEFDQDGTLWVEHPVYTQIVYCLDHVGALVKEKPELKDPSRSFFLVTARPLRSSRCGTSSRLCSRPRAG